MKNLKKKGFTNSKGFTIVELVIVIAVIAILSAVLIPTFSNLIKKANISADQQAVNSMNKYLKIEEVESGKPETVDKVIEVLIDNDYQSDLTTYYVNYNLGWVKEENVIVLIENNEVVYPADYVGKPFEIIKPMANDIESIKDALVNGDVVFVSENIVLANPSDLHFNTEGNYKLNLNGKTISTNVPNTSKGYNDGIVVEGSAQTSIVSGIIEGGEDIEQVLAVYDSATLEVKNVVLSGGNRIGVLAEAGGTAIISDTKVLGAIGTNPLQAYGGSLILNNVTAAQSGEADTAWYESVIQVAHEIAYVNDNWVTTGKLANVTINSGNYSGARAIQIDSPGGYVTINGGSFFGSEFALVVGSAANYFEQNNEYYSKVVINDGIFNGKIDCNYPHSTLIINGGKFFNTGLTIDEFREFVAEGKTVYEVDGYFEVK